LTAFTLGSQLGHGPRGACGEQGDERGAEAHHGSGRDVDRVMVAAARTSSLS
jgi:hypothetical protein